MLNDININIREGTNLSDDSSHYDSSEKSFVMLLKYRSSYIIVVKGFISIEAQIGNWNSSTLNSTVNLI